MGLLDKFSNPVWYKVSKLDLHRQLIVAIVIGSYDFCREYIQRELVNPLESFLTRGGLGTTVVATSLTADVRCQLTDEAVLGLLRCCRCPKLDQSRKLPSRVLQSLPEVWGTFVLADINHRLKRSSPTVLDQTHYSGDPDEARMQVLVRWMEILGVSTPNFATRVNVSGFSEAWDGLVESMISGILKGLSRTPDDLLISTGRRVAAELPSSRRALTEYLVDRLATAPFDDDGDWSLSPRKP